MIDLSTHLDDFSDEERMLRDAVSDYGARDEGLKRVRALRGTLPSHDPAAWREMAEMGWLGAGVPEDQGGLGLSHAQTALMLEQYGASLAPEPWTAVAVMAGGALLRSANAELRSRWLPRIVSGEAIVTLAWQEAPGQMDAGNLRARVTGSGASRSLSGAKCFVPHAEGAQAFLVCAQADDGPGVWLVQRDTPRLTVTTETRVDGGTWGTLRLDNVTVLESDRLATGPEATALVEAVLDQGRLAAGAELVGLMARAFELTVDYLHVREQFGKLIGSFQALQHKAVDLLLQVEISRAVLRQSAAAFDNAEGPQAAQRRARAASQLKARASDAALKVTKGCIQLHGGIGYTDECNIGLYLKRAMVLAAWLGGAGAHRARYAALTEALGEDSATDVSADPFRAEIRAFLAENFPPEARFPRTRMSLKETDAWQKALAKKGWMAPGWPREFGGMGLSAWDQIRMMEELDRHGVSIIPNQGVTMLGPLLIQYGTEEQRRRHLPGIASGEVRWCQGYSEPGAGSDLAALRTRAVIDGDDFVVNGQKIWTSFAHEAHWIFMLVRTDPEARKQNGISFLLADMNTPGITVKRIRNLTGESEFCEVFFDNVRVPRANLVGELNKGWSMAKSLLGSERIATGSPRMARYPLQLLRGLVAASDRRDDPLVRARLAELSLEVDDLAAAYVRVVDVLRRGGEAGAEVSLLKLWVTETMQRVTDMMVEFQAESGVTDGFVKLPDGTAVNAAGQFFMARPATIYAGSSEIQRNILAKAVLDLPG